MEALFLFFIPLIFYVFFRVVFMNETDVIEEDLKKFDEGQRLIEFGFIDEAVMYFDKMVKQYPKSAVAYGLRGKCHYLQNNYYTAIYNFEKASTFSNSFPEVFLFKGICLFKIEDYEAALKEFNKATWFYREQNPITYKWRGLTHKKLGNQEAAQKDFQRSLKLGDKDIKSFIS